MPDVPESCHGCAHNRRDEHTRRDLIVEFADHMAEEKQTKRLIEKMDSRLEALSEMHHNITTDEHQTLVDWWRAEMESRKQRRAVWQKVKESAAGWIIIALLGAIVHISQPIGRAVIEALGFKAPK